MAAPFDLKMLTIGEPRRPVVEGLKQRPLNAYASFCFSRDGLLYYVRGGEWHARRQLVWVNRRGEEVELLPLPLGAYKFPRVSPDGRHLAFAEFKGDNSLPLWIPDGKHLTFLSWRTGPFDVYQMPVDRSNTEDPFLTGPYDHEPMSWSSDGKALLCTEINPNTDIDICVLSTEGDPTPHPLLHEPWTERNPIFSFDGHWIAYESNQEGPSEIYVAPYPGPGGGKKISTDGGAYPVWSGDGKELFYFQGD